MQEKGESLAQDQIVIVTRMDDPHADNVIIKLQETGHEVVRLNTDDIPENVSMSFVMGFSGTNWRGGIDILTNGRRIDVDEIKSVWWRRPGGFRLAPDFSAQEREFAREEIDHVLRGIWSTLDCYWISYPEHIRQASWKGTQLQRAAEFGFDVPRTLITSSPDDARAFYGECKEQMIYKVMTDPFLGAQKVAETEPEQISPEIYSASTTLISEAELALLESTRLVPCLFQEHLPKKSELRVTVIGDDVFAAEILSQEHEETRLDWRNYDIDVEFHRADLPVDVADRCFRLAKSYELNFSAMDLILTPDGRYVFLENNPNGQFIFVEDRVPELRMTDALAACLVRGANS